METLQALSRDGRTDWGIHEDGLPDAGGPGSKDGMPVSEEEYWERWYHDPDFVYEWNDGRLEARPMSDVKGSKSHRWFCAVLDCYLTTYPVGTAVSLEIGFHLALPRKAADRVPDLAVVLNDNPVGLGDDDCTYKGVFDLCVESLSHSSSGQIIRDTVDKRREYAGVGVREYYILDARGIETAFYRLGGGGVYVPIQPTADGVIRSAVLPGFQFRVSDLYARPPLEALAEDEVYHHYVFPSHKEVRRRAEEEAERAGEAERLARQEAERAEQAERLARQKAERAEEAEQLAKQEAERAKQEAERAEKAEQLARQEAERAEEEAERAEEAERLARQEARLREQAERQFTETARSMLSNGLDIALVMKYTGLSPDELAALSQSMGE